MIPSLVNEMKLSYEEKIAGIEAREYEDEVAWLLARSRSWEEYARFFMKLGYYKQAYRCYDNAAMVCTYCSDRLWLQCETCEFPTLPLLSRFLSMHNCCKRLVKDHPFLRYEYEDSALQRCCLFFTQDDWRTEIEFRESYESMRAWRFGRR
ncbi:MAG: hypothetical protein IJ222_01460 [Bacteroidales bacterium]|nr:hypothetical protein [Bacteroidales bacterium]